MRAINALLVCLCISTFGLAQELRLQNAGRDSIKITSQFHSSFRSAPQLQKSEQAIPQNFYTQHFGFFCRQELKMEEVHVPVAFRLGSMDYCNWLEQKPGYR